MISEYFSYLIFSLAWKVTKSLPERVAYRLFARIASKIYHKNGKGVRRIRSNYRRVRPDLKEAELEPLVEEGMDSYLRYWCDTFRFPRWSQQRMIDSVAVENEELLRDHHAAGKGVIVALPHAGNWDHAGAYFCATGAPLTTVAEHLRPEKLFRKFLAYREAIGMEVLDLNSRTIGVLANRLRNGRLVALVADRDLGSSGVEVDFFGGKAKFPAGPALLAIQTGAPLLTAYTRYTATSDGMKRLHISFKEIEPEIGDRTTSEKVALLVQKIANNFERDIGEYVTDWHMMQRVWID